MKRWLIFTVFFIWTTALRSQNKLTVTFEQEPSRSTSIGITKRGGILYASITDLARVFHLKSSHTIETQKLELSTKQYTLRLTANNPFVVIFDQNRTGNVLQLQNNVLYQSNSFFVPAEEFINVFDDVMPEDISFDPSKPAIAIGKTIASSRFDITGISTDEKNNGYLIRLQCSKKLSDYESWTKPIGDDTWIYVTLSNARADIATINKTQVSGFLKKVLVFQSPKSTQLTLKVRGQVTSTELIPAEGSNDILLTVHRPSEEQLAARKTRDYEKQLDHERNRWKLDVVVIDAGHGGDDPGTIGVTRTKEKDVTLGIALKLGQLLQKQLPDVKVVYTRQKDEFIELYRRGQIANQAGGKLFISIHCNAMPRKPNPMNGFEIYLLRPGKTENAIHLAERENAAVKFEQGYEKHYQELTEENFILLTMAQNAYVKYSEKFADILQQEMGKRTNLENNGIKQAGFYVLVGASMPNVLVETAYLSNKHDEKLLKSPTGQQRIAESICSAVRRYKEEYEKSLQEGRDFGTGTR
jgi:N-acetylmuramoyl-L-alanine amidase